MININKQNGRDEYVTDGEYGIDTGVFALLFLFRLLEALSKRSIPGRILRCDSDKVRARDLLVHSNSKILLDGSINRNIIWGYNKLASTFFQVGFAITMIEEEKKKIDRFRDFRPRKGVSPKKIVTYPGLLPACSLRGFGGERRSFVVTSTTPF